MIKKRLPQLMSFQIRMLVGTCPLCSAAGRHLLALGVIYRRNHRSVTMRCERCHLQWTMTWAKIHQAAKTRKDADPMVAMLAEGTEPAARRETRGRRKRTESKQAG